MQSEHIYRKKFTQFSFDISKSMKRTGASSSQVERPHFFKIILSRENKLALPKKFVRTYGDYLSSRAILKVPTGLKWEVEIVKSNGQVWFQNGWPNFAEYYSVTLGTFIVFEFVKSDCEFNVTLFDKSCTEIDYPFSSNNEGNNNLGEQYQDDDSMKGTKRVTRSDFQSQNPSFRIVMQKSNVDRRSVLIIPPSFARNHLNKNGDAVFRFSDGRTWHVKHYTKKTSGYPITRVEHLGWSKFAKDISLRVGDVCVFELIDNAKTIFRVVKNGKTSSCFPKKSLFSDPSGAMDFANKRSTSANPSFQVEISSKILEHKYVYVPRSFMKSIKQETRLKVKNRCWPVKFIFSPIYGSGRFSAGWSAFAMENSLKPGDICTFELIDCGENPLVSVSIVRGSGSNSLANRDDKEAVPKVLTRSSILRKRKQESPFSFSEPSKKVNKVENIIEITGKDLGSTKQSMENKSINRKSDQKPSFLYRPGAAKKFTSENRFFQVSMTATHLQSGSTVHVPCKFIKNLEKAKQEVKLQVGNRFWSVNLSNYPECGKNSLTGGWINFARENCLKEGDVCSFELIDTQNMLIKVSISRNMSTCSA